MNPPYDGQTNLYGKLTNEALKHAKEVVCLSPYLNYLKDSKTEKLSEISQELEPYLKNWELVNSNIFDAEFDKQLCIFHFSDVCKDKKYFDDIYWTIFSNMKLAKNILIKIKNYNIKCHNVCSMRTVSKKEFDNYKYNCIMTFKRGNFNKDTGKKCFDWTTLFDEKKQTNFALKCKDIKTPNCHSIPFNTEIECKNFVQYCNTDIVMFIIYAYKRSLSQSSNLQYIPYMSTYTKSWSDDEIAKEIGLTKEEVDYIREEMKDFGWKTRKNK